MKQRGRHGLDVPEAVRGKAEALGEPGHAWLRRLPQTVRALEREWGMTAGPALHGGSAAYVAAAITAGGSEAVLKIVLPGYDSLPNEIRVLGLANGRGYPRLLRAGETRGAILVERLGRPLSRLGLPIAEQIAIICATLERAWARSPEAAGFPTGAEKARWLRDFITVSWTAAGRPCSEQVIERALMYAHAREAAFDPARAVLVHGDAHAANTLAPLHATEPADSGFKLIDPDGLFAERACDLAVPMRGWSAELLAGDPLRLGRERCALLSRLTGEDAEAIWQWGFVERVSTGLLLIQTGRGREGRESLRVAEAWVG